MTSRPQLTETTAQIANIFKEAFELLKQSGEHACTTKLHNAYIAAEYVPIWLLLKKEQQLRVRDIPENEGQLPQPSAEQWWTLDGIL